MKYLSYDGLAHLKLLLKNALNGKSDTGHKHTKAEITDYKDYELPTASAETLGGVKVGAGLAINEGVLSATGGGTADSVDWSNVQNRPTKVSQFTNDAGYLTAVPSEYITETELNAKKYLTAVPSEYITETELNAKGYKTASEVNTLIANAIDGIQGITYSVVTSLPSTGEAGVIYLVSNGGSNSNIYDEYIYANNKFEKIGTTDIDLSGYVETTDLVEITNNEIDTIWNS